MSIDVLEEMTERTLIMGILNCTPDSFSDGGNYVDQDAAIAHATKLIEDGADIIDVGGESTRPGAEPVSEDEELKRVVPVIKAIREEHREICISIDTYKAAVAEAALEAGADMVNDISALRMDENMGHVISRAGCPAVLMHMRGTPSTMNDEEAYLDLISEVTNFFRERLDIAATYGIDKRNLIIDPGLGFGKSPDHNVEIIRRLREIGDLGKPILIGPSRKLFHEQMRRKPFKNRLGDTIAAAVIGILNGACIVRLHDLGEARDAIWVADALT